MGAIEDRLEALGIELPIPMAPAGSYVGCVLDGDRLHVSGHGPVDGATVITGKVGSDLDVAAGRHAARLTALSLLATMQAELGTLDRVEQIVKLLGMVNVADGFDRMPAVIDGASDLFVEVFGARGRHARSAVGLASLPFGIAVEIELIARVR
jgi:enamine deaminase RidA (YjgF/YER057c/UK114 family)